MHSLKNSQWFIEIVIAIEIAIYTTSSIVKSPTAYNLTLDLILFKFFERYLIKMILSGIMLKTGMI